MARTAAGPMRSGPPRAERNTPCSKSAATPSKSPASRRSAYATTSARTASSSPDRVVSGTVGVRQRLPEPGVVRDGEATELVGAVARERGPVHEPESGGLEVGEP